MNGVKGHALIFGGAGFIGSHLCRMELEAGNWVTCVDNLTSSTGANIEDLTARPEFLFVAADVKHLNLGAVNKWEPTHIYNLACPASPVWYVKDPINTLLTSVVGMKNVLDMGIVTNAPILFTSTSEVYGDPLQHPQYETYNGNVSITGPRACYDEGKRAAETLCYDYGRVHNIQVMVARLFNTYGPDMAVNDGRVVSNFICQALAGEDLTVYGAGMQTRSFAYVEDTVTSLFLMMTKMRESRGLRFDMPINVGSTHEFSIMELAERVISMTGSSSKIVSRDLPKDDPSVRRPATQRLRALLGDQTPTFRTLEEGLAPAVEYFRKVLVNPAARLPEGENHA